MDCFQILPDLSVKNGAYFIPFNVILWRSRLGLGKGEEGERTHETQCARAAGPVGLDLSRGPVEWGRHAHPIRLHRACF